MESNPQTIDDFENMILNDDGGTRMTVVQRQTTTNFVNQRQETQIRDSMVSDFSEDPEDFDEDGEGRNSRHSSKVFSKARNFRMNQVYKYTKNKAWDYDNMFEFETKEFEQLMEKGINNIIPTNTMFIYVPIDTEMKLPGSESQRLVYYSQQYDYENTEL